MAHARYLERLETGIERDFTCMPYHYVPTPPVSAVRLAFATVVMA